MAGVARTHTLALKNTARAQQPHTSTEYEGKPITEHKKKKKTILVKTDAHTHTHTHRPQYTQSSSAEP